ncbi:MAG: MBL fold metallo-hydrolase [Treponema sp.]|nr:MBL fold metallo-hydrolase [Treponema sp.]
MKIVFWGVRGSTPAPLTKEQVQAKIIAAIMRVQSKDIISPDAREKFLASLPEYIFGTTGGNTPCVQLVADEKNHIIFDAGTGLRVMAKKSPAPENCRYSILFSHLHWDHIQGFPFFDPLFDSKSKIDIYSPFPDTDKYFAKQMRAPYFPVDFESVKERVNFISIQPGKEFNIGDVRLNCCKMSHPGGSYAYSAVQNGKKIVYATDVELYLDTHKYGPDVEQIFNGADMAVLDSQYTMEEAIDKIKWGHSPFSYAVDFAAQMDISKIFLFHHEPEHDDKKLDAILKAARWYAKFIVQKAVTVDLAVEGTEIEL